MIIVCLLCIISFIPVCMYLVYQAYPFREPKTKIKARANAEPKSYQTLCDEMDKEWERVSREYDEKRYR